jgi:MFS family permease
MPRPPAPAVEHQFQLLRQRRFAPFFWTQFLGAGNDNLFKFSFTMLVVYGGAGGAAQSGLSPGLLVQLIAALFILPFLLFSATAGQWADKYEKSRIMRAVKNLEIAIMLLAAWGLWQQQVLVLLLCTFGMGLHSTMFGPAKYAYLPQHLHQDELTGGNGLVEMGTFVAILMGNVAGGLLMAIPGQGPQWVALSCCAVAVMGRVMAQFVPDTPATDPDLHLDWNPGRVTWRNLRLAAQEPTVFRGLLGISWLWFFGAVFLTQFPALTKDVLKGDETVATLLLTLFSIGIGMGSLWTEHLSKRRLELGLVLWGGAGMTLFGVDLYFACLGFTAGWTGTSPSLSIDLFVHSVGAWRLMADLFLLSISAGIYSVPLYALFQSRSKHSHRARIVAANNILNALFMIVSAAMAMLMFVLGASVPQVLLATALGNAVMMVYLGWQVPEMRQRAQKLIGL